MKRKGLIFAIAMLICVAIMGSPVSVNAKAKQNFANAGYEVTLSQTEPFSVTLSDVANGQYSMRVELTGGSGYDYVFATINDETIDLFNIDAGIYTGVINVQTGDDLTLSTTSTEVLTGMLYLNDLELSSANDYILSNVRISSEKLPIKVVTEAKDYNITVELGTKELAENEEIQVQVGESTTYVTLKKDNNFYGTYNGKITFTQTNQPIYIWVQNTASEQPTANNYIATISLAEIVTYSELPTSAENAAELSSWTPVIYSYTATATDYFTITSNLSEEDSKNYSVFISLKNDPESYEGTTAGANIPMYLEKDNTYYFEVTLAPLGMTMGDAKVWFTVDKWNKPTITLNSPVSVPITEPADAAVIMDLTLDSTTEPVEYSISLTELPDSYYWGGTEVTVYIGVKETTEPTEPIEPIKLILNTDNEFSSTVELSGSRTIYLTAPERAVATLAVSIPEKIIYITTDGKENSITIPAKSTVNRYIQNAEVGFYSIEISSAEVIVSTGLFSELPTIPLGKKMGGFKINFAQENYPISFENTTESDITFTAKIMSEKDVTLTLSGNNNVVVPGNARKAYYFEGLIAGEYEMEFDSAVPATLKIYAEGEKDFVSIIPEEIDEDYYVATFTVTSAQDSSGLVTLIFENESETQVNLTFAVYPTATIRSDTITTINVSGDYAYTAYYFEARSTGTYAIALELPENMDVSVTANFVDVVVYGGVAGVFKVDTAGFVALRFNIYNYSDKTDFKAYISRTNSMKLGEKTTVTVEGTELAATYNLGTLNAGLYTVTVTAPEGAKIAANGVVLGDNNTFEVTNYAQENCIITLFGAGSYEITVALTQSYLVTLGEEFAIDLPEYGYREYYIDLSAGTYNITLDKPGVEIYVNGVTVVGSTATEGSFTVTIDPEETVQTVRVTIVVTNYTSGGAVTIKATVSQAQNN